MSGQAEEYHPQTKNLFYIVSTLLSETVYMLCKNQQLDKSHSRFCFIAQPEKSMIYGWEPCVCKWIVIEIQYQYK